MRFQAVLILLMACAPSERFVWYSEVPTGREPVARTTIAPGDRILVQVDGHPELSGEFAIGASGSYNQPIAGLVAVAGLEPTQAATLAKHRLSRFVEVSSISVTLLAYRPLSITVVGEVRAPGTRDVPHGSGVITALGVAGGLSEFADEDEIYVLRVEPTPQRIRFRYADLTRPEPAAVRFKLLDGDTVLVD